MLRVFTTFLSRAKSTSAHLSRDFEIARLRGSDRRKVYIKNHLNLLMRMEPKLEEILAPLRHEVKTQGDLVRSLKQSNAPKAELDQAIKVLNEKKRILESKEESLCPKNSFVDRSRLEDTLKRRFFFDNSFSIYGGVAGLFDYGPYGVAIKKEILRLWESHFVLEDDLLEIEASQLTPHDVLKASGHVDRFTDAMVTDTKTGDCHRLDHLIKAHLEKLASAKDCKKRDRIDTILNQLDNYDMKEMGEIVKEFDMKAPATGNELSEPVEFNLMFSTSIGPKGENKPTSSKAEDHKSKCYLRPETAQGIFVNFKRLLEANAGKLPFGVAQIGKSFRNEISPRGGLIRMREFTMGEIEYFVDPQDKSHSKYDLIKDLELHIYSACDQMDGKPAKLVSLQKAVDAGTVANQVLAYYLGRIHLFMLKIGIDQSKIRFRQHMANEMAHYATDCWDCECLTHSGWLECIGCADRSCYDLTQHANERKVKLSANRPLKEAKLKEFVECEPQKAVIGKVLRGEGKVVIDKLAAATEEDISSWEKELESGLLKLTINDKTYELTKDMIQIKRENRNVHVEEIVPNVIEPSFGIDRIIHTLLEHNYKIREDNNLRTYFTFPPVVAPIKCSILPLSNSQEFSPFVKDIANNLKLQGVRAKIDSSGESIGKRYARTDEIGVPFAITIDFDTLTDKSVTLRDCCSLEQVRINLDSLSQVVSDLTKCNISWSDVAKQFPKFTGQQNA